MSMMDSAGPVALLSAAFNPSAWRSCSSIPSGWNYQYLAADPSVFWVMGLEKSMPLERRYYNRQDWSIVPRRLTQRVEPIHLQWLVVKILKVFYEQFVQRLNTQTQVHLDTQAQQLAQRLYLQSGEDPRRYIRTVLNWYQQNHFVYTLKPGVLGKTGLMNFCLNPDRVL